MTRDEFMDMIRSYGTSCVSDGRGYTFSDTDELFEQITKAVHAHWDSEPMSCEHCGTTDIDAECTKDKE